MSISDVSRPRRSRSNVNYYEDAEEEDEPIGKFRQSKKCKRTSSERSVAADDADFVVKCEPLLDWIDYENQRDDVRHDAIGSYDSDVNPGNKDAILSLVDHVVAGGENVDFDGMLLKVRCWSFSRGSNTYKVPIVFNCPELILKWADLQRAGGFGSHSDFLHHLLAEESTRQNSADELEFTVSGRTDQESSSRWDGGPPITAKPIKKRKLAEEEPTKAYECNVCERLFGSQRGLSRHKTDEHSDLHSCPVCKKVLENKMALTKHLATHKQSFGCEKCGKKYNLKNSLKYHMAQHGENDVECSKCRLQFTDLQSLMYHNRVHEACAVQDGEVSHDCHSADGTPFNGTRSEYYCDVCEKNFKDKAHLRLHQKVVHAGRFACKKCGRQFRDNESLIEHQYTHAGLTSLICSKCELQFHDQVTLDGHLQAHLEADGDFDCHKCDRGYLNQTDLNSHCAEKHSPFYDVQDDRAPSGFDSGLDGDSVITENDGEIEQEASDKEISVDENDGTTGDQQPEPCTRLKRRVAGRRTPESTSSIMKGEYKCEKCEKTFKSKKLVGMHLKRVHDARERWPCTTCGVVFADRRTLLTHDYIHTGVKAFKCDKCPKTFIGRGAYRNHKRIHVVEAVKCNQCARTFANEHCLLMHLRSHVAEFVGDLKDAVGEALVEDGCFKCPECGIVYKAKEKYLIHYRRMHMNAAFHCQHCERKFKTDVQLQEHAFVHTGVKGFKCGKCSKEFVVKKSLEFHLKFHSNSGLHGCELCGKEFAAVSQLKQHFVARHDGDDIELEEVFLEKGEISAKINIENQQLFVCSGCEKRFADDDSRDRHFETTHQDGLFDCHDCGTFYREEDQLKEHSFRHSGVKGFSCSQCGKSYINKQVYDMHVKLHQDGGLPTCKFCNSDFKDVSDLTQHQLECPDSDDLGVSVEPQCNIRDELKEDAKSGSQRFKCNSCDKFFVKRRSRQRHYVTVHKDGAFKCETCAGAYRTETQLQEHRYKHTGVKPFQCDHCDREFCVKISLDLHMRHHTKIKLRICKICAKEFPTTNQLKEHLLTHDDEMGMDPGSTAMSLSNHPMKSRKKTTHNKDIPGVFLCEECGKTFSKERLRDRHYRDVHADGNFICSTCGKKFRYSRLVKEHSFVHTGVKAYKCDHCEKSFAHQKTYRYHLREHTGQNLSTCDKCGKSFTNSHKLKNHLARHNDGKPECMLVCDFCGKLFLSEVSLKCHKQTHNAPQHFCKFCNKSFNRLSNKVKHEMIHTGERPYKCPCGRAYSDKSNYNKHVESHDRSMLVFQCEQCPKAFRAEFSLKNHVRLAHPPPGYRTKRFSVEELEDGAMGKEGLSSAVVKPSAVASAGVLTYNDNFVNFVS